MDREENDHTMRTLTIRELLELWREKYDFEHIERLSSPAPSIATSSTLTLPMTSVLPIKEENDVIVVPDDEPDEPVFIKSIKQLHLGHYCYVQVNKKNCKNWYKAAITGVLLDNDNNHEDLRNKHKIIYELITFGTNLKNKPIQINCSKQIALYDAPKESVLELGTKVIGKFQYSKETGECSYSRFESGIIAERPQQMNCYRYLVFFHGNQVGYVPNDNIRSLLEQDSCPWSDFDTEDQDFIQNYFSGIDRHGYQPNPFQRSESVYYINDGMPMEATILKVDCSLVLIFLSVQSRGFWLYHGSPYLKSKN